MESFRKLERAVRLAFPDVEYILDREYDLLSMFLTLGPEFQLSQYLGDQEFVITIGTGRDNYPVRYTKGKVSEDFAPGSLVIPFSDGVDSVINELKRLKKSS